MKKKKNLKGEFQEDDFWNLLEERQHLPLSGQFCPCQAELLKALEQRKLTAIHAIYAMNLAMAAAGITLAPAAMAAIIVTPVKAVIIANPAKSVMAA